MPEKRTKREAARRKRRGNKATTQAGAYVGEEMRHKRRGKHRVTSRKQAIAIGLSKARRAGVKVPKKKAASRSKARKSHGGRTRRRRSR
jgi:hypothetical protein